MTGQTRMTGGELQTAREYLGLTTESLAVMLGVRHDTVRRWESGRIPIPLRVREEIEQIQQDTAATVAKLAAELRSTPDPTAVVYRTDDDLHRARPDVEPAGARWWRHVVARASAELPGVAIGTPAELAKRDVEGDDGGERDSAD